MRIIRFTLVLIGILLTGHFYGQQDAHYTQYMYNTSVLNPAYTGSRACKSITALGRMQWVGFDGAPDTENLTYDGRIGYSRVGLGFNLMNDVIGPSREVSLDANVSYSVQVSEKGSLAFGLKLGGRLYNLNENKLTPKDREPETLGMNNKFLPTVGAGIYYYTDKFYAGISVPNFLTTDHYKENKGFASERLHFFGIVGYVFDLSDSVKFKPAGIVKAVPGAPLSVDVSANFLFKQRFVAGLAWRWDDSVAGLLGFQISKRFYIGYAYDLTTSPYRVANSGTHELMLRLDFCKEEAIVSPRFF